MSGLHLDADLLTMPAAPGAKAIVWGVAPIVWDNISGGKVRESNTYDGMEFNVAGYINDTLVIKRSITREEAIGMDTMIGFTVTDALGCSYGFGILFAKAGR